MFKHVKTQLCYSYTKQYPNYTGKFVTFDMGRNYSLCQFLVPSNMFKHSYAIFMQRSIPIQTVRVNFEKSVSPKMPDLKIILFHG